MKLDELMELNSMDKAQLVQLCNALYELLQKAQPVTLAVAPYNPPASLVPYLPPSIVPVGPNTVPFYEVTCNTNGLGVDMPSCERKL